MAGKTTQMNIGAYISEDIWRYCNTSDRCVRTSLTIRVTWAVWKK